MLDLISIKGKVADSFQGSRCRADVRWCSHVHLFCSQAGSGSAAASPLATRMSLAEDAASRVSPGVGAPPVLARVSLGAPLEGAGAEALRSAWRSQELYVDHLEAHNKRLEGVVEKMKEQQERWKLQQAECQHRERVVVRRLAAKEQQLQDYVAQISELKSGQVGVGAGGAGSGRACMLDPAVNLLVMRMKQELQSTKTHLEDTQNEFSAWKFTPDSNTGKKLMAKCRLLHQENEDLGRITTSGRIAKLEGDLALQKGFSEEIKKSQSEFDDFLQELDEDVEGMQSTILYLQQELRGARQRAQELGQELAGLRQGKPALTNGEYDAAQVNGSRTSNSDDKKRCYESDSSECSNGAPPKKQRRASVLSLDYNEEEEPLTAANGDAN